MTRRAVAQLPTYRVLEPGRDAYLSAPQLEQLVPPTSPGPVASWRKSDPAPSSHYWVRGLQPCTVKLEGDRYAKSLRNFHSHDSEAKLRRLLEEYASYGIDRPSGYCDLFRQRFRAPRVTWTTNAALAESFAGGWVFSAAAPGESIAYPGVWYEYDLNRAYYAAAEPGFPDPATFIRSLDPWDVGPRRPSPFGRLRRQGLYRIRLNTPHPGRPYPYDVGPDDERIVLATPEEIAYYDLDVAELLDGVTWSRWLDNGRAIHDAIDAEGNSFRKYAGQSYWGQWAQAMPIERVIDGQIEALRSRWLNVVWAHFVVGRVRRVLFDHSPGAIHGFVDMLITNRPLPEGTAPGTFRLEQTFDQGIRISGPGQYTPLHAGRWHKMAGVRHDSPLRCISAPDGEHTPISLGDSHMAQELNSRDLAGFYKFTEIGQRIVGKVERFFGNENGTNATLSPALVWSEPIQGVGRVPMAYQAVAIGLATDLKLKIDQREQLGKYLSIELTGFTPSNKGNPRKNFRVLSLSIAEAKALGANADLTNRAKVYPKPIPERQERPAAAADPRYDDPTEEAPEILPW